MIKKFRFSFEEMGITVDNLEEFMGYEKGTSLESFGKSYHEALNNAPALTSLEGGYKIFEKANLIPETRTVRINETTFNTSGIIYSQLKGSTGAILFMCTAGPGISQLSKKLMGGEDLLLGYIYDVIGSICVEKAIDKIHDNLQQEFAGRGLGVTHRFSPGYCNWSVSEQHKLFSFFPKGFCGISLSESSLMDPIKSVSGIIGTGPSVIKKKHPCYFCKDANCFRNRSKVAL
jgi:hypothetical protein